MPDQRSFDESLGERLRAAEHDLPDARVISTEWLAAGALRRVHARQSRRARWRTAALGVVLLTSLALFRIGASLPGPDFDPGLDLAVLVELSRTTERLTARLALLDAPPRPKRAHVLEPEDHRDWLAWRWVNRSERDLARGHAGLARESLQRVLDQLPNTLAADRARERIDELNAAETASGDSR